jgi:hypothetical protein
MQTTGITFSALIILQSLKIQAFFSSLYGNKNENGLGKFFVAITASILSRVNY